MWANSADIETGGVIEEQVDRDDGPGRECVFESVELPQSHGEGNVGGLGALLWGGVDMADADQ